MAVAFVQTAQLLAGILVKMHLKKNLIIMFERHLVSSPFFTLSEKIKTPHHPRTSEASGVCFTLISFLIE
jgi:hypothetical protein